MLSNAREALLIAPWVAAAPGVMIFVTVMGFNMLGDGLRDAMDPKIDLSQDDWDDGEVERVLEGTEVSYPVSGPEGDPSPGGDD